MEQLLNVIRLMKGLEIQQKKHLKTIEKHGWSKYFNVDLMDAEGPDMVLDIPEGKVIQKKLMWEKIWLNMME